MGTFDLLEPLGGVVSDGIFDLSGFCEPQYNASRMRVPVFRGVPFWSFLAFQPLGVRALCRRVHPTLRALSC